MSTGSARYQQQISSNGAHQADNPLDPIRRDVDKRLDRADNVPLRHSDTDGQPLANVLGRPRARPKRRANRAHRFGANRPDN
ncbi:MAG: hypothetical protein ABIP03_07850 [Aquihabitans sp.]